MSSPTESPREPRLAAVPAGEATSPGPGDERRGSQWRSRIVLLLVALLVIGLALQTRRVGEYQARIGVLDEQVAALAGELGDAQSRLDALQRERGQIRAAVSRLASELQALEALVGPAPAAEPVPELLFEDTELTAP